MADPKPAREPGTLRNAEVPDVFLRDRLVLLAQTLADEVPPVKLRRLVEIAQELGDILGDAVVPRVVSVDEALVKGVLVEAAEIEAELKAELEKKAEEKDSPPEDPKDGGEVKP